MTVERFGAAPTLLAFCSSPFRVGIKTIGKMGKNVKLAH